MAVALAATMLAARRRTVRVPAPQSVGRPPQCLHMCKKLCVCVAPQAARPVQLTHSKFIYNCPYEVLRRRLATRMSSLMPLGSDSLSCTLCSHCWLSEPVAERVHGFRI